MRTSSWLWVCSTLLFTPVSLAAPALSVRTNDGLSLGLDARGAIQQVSVDGTPLPLLGDGGFFISEVTAAQAPLPMDGATRPGAAVLGTATSTGPNEITVTGHVEVLAADFTAVIRGGAALRMTAHLSSNRTGDRAFVIYFRVPVAAEGWKWSGALDASRVLAAGDRGYDEFHWWKDYRTTTSASPVVAINSNTAGLALVIPPTTPTIYRITHQAPYGFQAEWEVGLADEPTRFRNSADVEALLYRVDPKWGYRSALKRLYMLYPKLWTKRALDGSWYIDQSSLSSVENPQDFAMRFSETMTWANSINRDHGIYALRYVEPWNDHIFEGLDVLRAWAADSPDNQLNTYMAKGEPRQVTAQSALLSGVIGRDGQYAGVNDPANFTDQEGSHRYVQNPDWEIPNFLGFSGNSIDVGRVLNRGQAVEEYEITRQWGKKPASADLIYDGLYLDSTNTSGVGWAGWHMFNFRREHFATTESPLVFDPQSGKVALSQALSGMKSVRRMVELSHGAGKLVMSNGLPDPHTFWTGAWTDFLAPGEGFHMGLDEVRATRVANYTKPMAFLNNSNVTATQFAHSLLYACFPGGAGQNQNRGVYKTWAPILLQVAAAGWEPLTFAHSTDPGVLVERYGRLDRGTLHLVAHRESGSGAASKLVIDKASMGIGEGVKLAGHDLVSNRPLALEDLGATLELPVQLEDEQSVAVRLTVTAGAAGITEGESLPPPAPEQAALDTPANSAEGSTLPAGATPDNVGATRKPAGIPGSKGSEGRRGCASAGGGAAALPLLWVLAAFLRRRRGA
ncbi:MAG: hypothetical protein ACYC8T_12605 [Myxococcaceae bacterium]